MSHMSRDTRTASSHTLENGGIPKYTSLDGCWPVKCITSHGHSAVSALFDGNLCYVNTRFGLPKLVLKIIVGEIGATLQKQCSNLSLTDASVAVVFSGNTHNATGFVFNMCAVPTMHFALYTQSEYTPTMHFALYTQSQYIPTMQSALS